MTRKQLAKNIRTRLQNENNIDVPQSTIEAMITILEDEMYMVIANEDELKFVWGTIYGEERPPKRIGGKFAEYQTIIENYGYSSWKKGYPKIKWSKAALVNDSHPAVDYFSLPEHRYTTKAREFRKIANLPEIPEYENLSEEEITELCKRADKREFEALPPRRKYRKRADDQSNMVKKIGSAMFWEANNIKPFYSFGEYYKGEQRDGVTDFLDICYSDDLDAPHKLDVIRSAIDMMKYKKLEEKHAYLYEMEKNLVEEVKANGLTEIEHATVIPDPYQLRRNYMGVKDAWSLEEERREWEEQWLKDHGIDENTKTVWSSSFFVEDKKKKDKTKK